MKVFYFFGHNGWSLKFLDIHKYLSKLMHVSELDGLICGSGLKELLNKHAYELTNKLSDFDQLFFNFLDAELDTNRMKELEKKYGNLWQYINAERRFVTYLYEREFQSKKYTHEELLKIIVGQFDYFESRLKDKDVLITIPPASSWAKVMCVVANYYNVQIINLDQVGYPPNRVTITSSFMQRWTMVDALFDKCKGNNKAKEWPEYKKAVRVIESYRNKPQPPPWSSLKNTSLKLSKWVNKSKIERVVKRLYSKHIKKEKNVKVPSYYLQIKQYALVLFRKKLITLRYKFDSFNPEGEYFYYALHVEPEASLMLSGKRALNQRCLIQRISAQLPAGSKLYVKEHPTMLGWRNSTYYDSLRKIPNVKVIGFDVSTEVIIKNAKAVITVVGTTGWEALMMKKPLFVIGEPFYKNLSMVRYVKDIDDLSDDLIWLDSKYTHNENELLNFLSCIIRCSIEVPYEYFWGIADDVDTYNRIQGLTHTSEAIATAIYHSINSKGKLIKEASNS